MPIPDAVLPREPEKPAKFDEANLDHQRAVIDSANEFLQECMVERDLMDEWSVAEAWERHTKRMERIGIR